ncbi:hypothetical protein ACES2L_13495 [Bdellovibrio bacteriovorus]
MNLNSRGQGVLEAVLSLPILLTAGIALGLLLYRGLIFSYSDYHLREALICADGLSLKKCETELTRRIEKILSKNTKLDVQLKESANHFSAEIKIQFHQGDTEFSKILNKLSPQLILKNEASKNL